MPQHTEQISDFVLYYLLLCRPMGTVIQIAFEELQWRSANAIFF